MIKRVLRLQIFWSKMCFYGIKVHNDIVIVIEVHHMFLSND